MAYSGKLLRTYIKNKLRRNILFTLGFVPVVLLNNSCHKQVELTFPKPLDSVMIRNIRTVVILGNSIVRYGPDPGIGWSGDWGLAASKKESDFVHILIQNLRSKDHNITVRFRSIANFEADFLSFPMNTVDSLRNADLIVMKIGENVNAGGAHYDQFITHYDRLIRYLDPSNKAVKLIVDGFWDHKEVNSDIRNYALFKKYPLISITDLSSISGNKGLAGHPNDQGMRLIADRLWNYISHYF
jgi:hypothetical protein